MTETEIELAKLKYRKDQIRHLGYKAMSDLSTNLTPEPTALNWKCGHANCGKTFSEHIRGWCFSSNDPNADLSQTFTPAAPAPVKETPDYDTWKNGAVEPVGETPGRRWPVWESENELQRIIKEHPEYVDGTHIRHGIESKTTTYGLGWRQSLHWLHDQFIEPGEKRIASLLAEVDSLKTVIAEMNKRIDEHRNERFKAERAVADLTREKEETNSVLRLVLMDIIELQDRQKQSGNYVMSFGSSRTLIEKLLNPKP